ncbi:MAG: UDP-N-acetylmuramate dehydrogenase [Candidatus Peribacteria bacterium]|jgi:UDP-N-acetylmuramate dehydrogenase|nr:UDP-N-acetylmuramate dehydrogenase [Candidatus Peribacteria bacterium]
MLTIQSNISLLPYTTFRIDVQTKYFTEIHSEAELQELFSSPLFQQEKKQILGGGAKTFFTKDFEGLVIKVAIKGIQLEKETETQLHIRAGAGEDWSDFVTFCNEQNRAGIENLIAIPGNVGTAPFSNIGAYGVEVGKVVERVEGYDLTTGEKKTYSHEQCQFGYRTSIFKSALRNQFLITAVGFTLQKFNDSYPFITKYPDVQTCLQGITPKSLTEISDIIADIRSKKLPDVKKIGTVGSFFVNPFVCQEHFLSLQKAYPEMPFYPVADTPEVIKLSAGRLIEKAGLKGYSTGKVGTFPQNALAIVNESATASEVVALVDYIQQTVKEKF